MSAAGGPVPSQPPRWVCCVCLKPVAGCVYFQGGERPRPVHKECRRARPAAGGGEKR